MTFKPITLPVVAAQLNLSAIDPLDARYYDPNIAQYLSEESRITYQAYVEAALAQTLADFKICKRSQAQEIEAAARQIKAKDVYKEEQITRHDIKAVVNCIKKQVSPAAQPYVHFGATSYDIIATASALQMRDALRQVVIPRLVRLRQTVAGLATEHVKTIQIGRTHGQHAVPITFGFALAEYVSRLGQTTEALQDLSTMLVGKFSGAVGAYNALSLFVDKPVQFEAEVLDKVGLKPAEYSKQIVPPEAMIRIMDELAVAAGIMANLSHDMRHLQRTEIAEVQERFEKGQTGSSTMAHKRNPWNFENVVSMSKQVVAQTVNANLNLTSEHQRDLTDSASSRFYTISLACVASMASRLERIMGKLEVNTENMQRNLHMTGGAIAAEPLYLLFEKHGHTQAHEKAKALAHQALAAERPLADVVAEDREAVVYWQKFSRYEQQIIAQPERYYTGLAAQKAQKILKKWQ